MEILVGVLVPLVECASPHIAKRWEYHRDFNRNIKDLGEALDKLKSRKSDIETKLESMVVQDETEEGSEVKSWLERVEKICKEVEDIQKQVRDVKFFSRASLGKKAAEKKTKVDELYQEGEFPDGDLVRTLQQRGNVKQTAEIPEGETTFGKKRDEIWRCLLDDKFTKIGVYGMGGVGKTTALECINNRLLEEKDKFDKVIWVTVSNKSNVGTLQDKIAHKLELDISNVSDEETRAEELRKGFVKSKRYVLILDDLWEAEHDTLKKVGIPDPAPINGCKLVLTTRSLNVCRMINCDSVIEMIPLSEKEALELFFEKVGRDVSSNSKLEKLVEKVARECARLPLAIVVVAGSLRNKTDPNEWEVALAELKDATATMSSKVTRHLRLSYDWLKDEKLKDCLLYCALYPEDYPIERSLLVDQLIADGTVQDIKTSEYRIKKGQVMLNELVSVCLLNDTVNDKWDACVKMHDLIRDMAIQIMHETPSRFLLMADKGLSSMPGEEKWNEDLEKVTLRGNGIVEIPTSIEPPKCPRISTFLFNSNSLSKGIPNNFFLRMQGLNVLDLSDTGIEYLPESVSDLVNLVVLLLRECRELIYMPSLAKLRNMRRLDFCRSGIKEVPKGMEMLIKLTYLNLSGTQLKFIPDGVLCKLTNLQYLSVIPRDRPKGMVFREEELNCLTKLETFEFAVANVNSCNECIRSLNEGEGLLTNMRLDVENRQLEILLRQKIVQLFSCIEYVAEGGLPVLLPKNVEELRILWCDGVSSLWQLTSLEYVTKLMNIHITECRGIEHLFHCTPSIFPLLQRLERLELQSCEDLRGLVNMERASFPLPPGSFSSLKVLHLRLCGKVKKVFILNNAFFPNLEEINIEYCHNLEEIISIPSSENDHRANEDIVALPKLRILYLYSLPELKSIPFISDSLEEITVRKCVQIKRIPLLDREPRPPSLRQVNIDDGIPTLKEAIRNF